jgi:hypothetical protein
MSEFPKEGVCFFAYNNDQIDYVKMATLAATHVKEYLNKPVCLITDEGSEAWLRQSQPEKLVDHCFDYIINTNDVFRSNPRGHYDSPWTEFRAQFSNSNKHKVWEYSPFEKTILMDTDYIVKSNFLNCAFETTEGVAMFRDAVSLRNEHPQPREILLYDAGIKMWWSTVIYFDRSELSKMFFDLWAHVADNYDFYQYLYNFPGKLFRTDYCVSIATHILNGMMEGDTVQTFSDTPMYYMDQKDDIVDVNNAQDWIMLSHDRREPWKNILVNHSKLDLHVMNKRALGRVHDKLMGEFYE